MAIGTPVDAGQGARFIASTAITLDSTFTSVADELILVCVAIPGSSTTPDSISNHDGKQSWVQLGSTEVQNGKSASLWGAISNGTSSTAITVQRSTASLMTAVAVRVTGVDASGTVANAYDQLKQGGGYSGSPSLTFDTSVSDTTVHFWATNDQVAVTVENTELNNQVGNYNHCRLVSDYAASGDTTPSATLDYSQYSGYFALELKEGGGGGGGLSIPIAAYHRRQFNRG